MSNQATKDDVNEVLKTVKTLMDQIASKFSEVEKRFDTQDVKYDHWINTIDWIY